MFAERIFTSVICSGFVNHKLKRIPEKFVTSAWYISVVSLSGCGGVSVCISTGSGNRIIPWCRWGVGTQGKRKY